MGAGKNDKQKMKELEQALRQKEREVYSIQRIGKALSSTLQLDELLRLIVQEITTLMNADRGTLYIVDHECGEIWSKIALKAEVKEIRQTIGKGISGVVAQTGETINIPDAYQDDRFDPTTDKKTGYRTRSILCMPVWEPLSSGPDRKIIAVLQLLNKKEGVFSKEDESLLEALASQVAISISNSQLYHRLEKKFKEIDLLYELEQMLNSVEEIPGMITRILSQTASHLQAKWVLSAYPTEEEGILSASNHRGEYFFDTLPVLPNLLTELATNPSKSILQTHWADIKDYFRLNDDMDFSSDMPVLFSPIEIDEEHRGILIALDVQIGRSQQFADEQKMLELVAQKISRAHELNSLRESLLKRERLSAIGQLMSTIVHDLRGPVNTIYGFVDLMRDEESDTEREEYADIIRNEIQSMMNMITEVLDFAKGKTNILPRKTNVVDILKQFQPRLEQICQKNHTTLQLEIDSRRMVYVDIVKLNRVFYNITKNAMEAMGRGGQFTFRVFDQDDRVVFEFVDTGPGIPQEIQNRLVESFVTSGKESGTGLGLAIVKKIVDEHSGQIEIDSHPGEGATFRIILPEYRK